MTALPAHTRWTDESAPVPSARRARVVADYELAERREAEARARAETAREREALSRFAVIVAQIGEAEERDNRGPAMLRTVLLCLPSLAFIAAVVWRVWNGGWSW